MAPESRLNAAAEVPACADVINRHVRAKILIMEGGEKYYILTCDKKVVVTHKELLAAGEEDSGGSAWRRGIGSVTHGAPCLCFNRAKHANMSDFLLRFSACVNRQMWRKEMVLLKASLPDCVHIFWNDEQ